MQNNNNFDYDVVNTMLSSLSFSNNAANLPYRNKGMQPSAPAQFPQRNPNMVDAFGDYFDDGLVRGSMQPVGFFQRQGNVDSMEFNAYQASLM